MDLISRKTLMLTPAMAIDELLEMREGAKWYRKRLRAVRQHLETCRFHERPLLDEPMSLSAIDAVLKEAWHTVSSPAYRQREYEQVMRDVSVN